MDIIKLQCISKIVAIKCSEALRKKGIKEKQLGSAVVYLSTMHNTNQASDVANEFKAHSVDVSDYDKSQLLS